jgi:hypothetical protein
VQGFGAFVVVSLVARSALRLNLKKALQPKSAADKMPITPKRYLPDLKMKDNQHMKGILVHSDG